MYRFVGFLQIPHFSTVWKISIWDFFEGVERGMEGCGEIGNLKKNIIK
jgi:hypothetical protein